MQPNPKINNNIVLNELYGLLEINGKAELPEKEGFQRKIASISNILKDNPQFLNNPEVKEKVVAFLRHLPPDVATSKINEFKNNFPVFAHLTNKQKAVPDAKIYRVTEERLKEMDEEKFWEELERGECERLIITQADGKRITYEERVLSQLIDLKPSLDSLTQEFTVSFPEEEKELKLPKAELLLCGEQFEMFKFGHSSSTEFKGVTTFDRLSAILKEVREGETTIEFDDEYKEVCDFLGYSKWYGMPEGGVGPKEWNKMFGVEIKNSPRFPKKFRKILSDQAKNGIHSFTPFLLPKGMTLNTLERLIKDDPDLKFEALTEEPKDIPYAEDVVWEELDAEDEEWGDPGEAEAANNNRVQENEEEGVAPRTEGGSGYFATERVKRERGEEKVELTHWCLFRNHVMPESWGEVVDGELPLSRAIKSLESEGMYVPSVWTAAICSLLAYKKNGQLLFGESEDPNVRAQGTFCSDGEIEEEIFKELCKNDDSYQKNPRTCNYYVEFSREHGLVLRSARNTNPVRYRVISTTYGVSAVYLGMEWDKANQEWKVLEDK